jgi:hypothetical protein
VVKEELEREEREVERKDMWCMWWRGRRCVCGDVVREERDACLRGNVLYQSSTQRGRRPAPGYMRIQGGIQGGCGAGNRCATK